MENEKSEHVTPRAVAGATRMPNDATDDDEVRERGVVLENRFHCGRPNPVTVNCTSVGHKRCVTPDTFTPTAAAKNSRRERSGCRWLWRPTPRQSRGDRSLAARRSR